jgi:integrase
VLDATGCRIGELTGATVGDFDESRNAFRVRSAVSKTRRARWVTLPADLWQATVEQLPPPDDRHDAMALYAVVTPDRLRTALSRACVNAGVPVFSPHDLRHRRVSLLHRAGTSWAEIGGLVGQTDLATTANTYSHVLVDYREVHRAGLLAWSLLLTTVSNIPRARV